VSRLEARTVEEIRAQAFLLRARAYGESDTIAVFLTAEHGKISGIARGARRSRRRFGGAALQPFHELAIRYKPRSHSELVFLEESRVLESFDTITSRVDGYAWASYLTELTEVVLAAGDPCAAVFEFYRGAIERLAGDAPPAPCSQHYVLQLLEQAGWCPDFEHCSVCGAELSSGADPIIDPRGGGVICSRHGAEQVGRDERPRRRVIDPALLAHVRASRESPQLEASTETLGAATLLLDRLIELHVPRALRTRRVLAELTSPERIPGSIG
jgi:DNA repair protein RecO (recombination protein O)